MQTGLLYYFLSSSNFSLFDLLEESRRKKVTKEATLTAKLLACQRAVGWLDLTSAVYRKPAKSERYFAFSGSLGSERLWQLRASHKVR